MRGHIHFRDNPIVPFNHLVPDDHQRAKWVVTLLVRDSGELDAPLHRFTIVHHTPSVSGKELCTGRNFPAPRRASRANGVEIKSESGEDVVPSSHATGIVWSQHDIAQL